MLDQRNSLYRFAHALDWEFFEGCFETFYSDEGRPAKPIRLMVGLLLLKQLKNLSDEAICEAWKENPYMQYCLASFECRLWLGIAARSIFAGNSHAPRATWFIFGGALVTKGWKRS